MLIRLMYAEKASKAKSSAQAKALTDYLINIVKVNKII